MNSPENRTSCDREHNRVLELEAEIFKLHNMLKESEKRCVFIQKDHIDLHVKFQKFKECANSNATPSNAIFEISKLKDQLQERDETIRNLESQFNISRMSKIGSPVGSLDKNALETEITQLKDNITSLRIQNDGYKIEIANHTRRYLELSKKRMYAISSEYITPPRREDWAPPTPRKKHVTFQEPLRVSTTHTKQPAINNHKQPNVNVIVSTGLTPAAEVIQIVLWYLDSGCSRHMTGDRSKLINYVEKFVGTVRFGNDQFEMIIGYGDYKMGNTIISRVYYVEGLSHNLFSVGQFCDGASPVCLLTKASSTKSWLWHRRLNHLNFGTLNELAHNDLVRGLPLLKYDKDHLCPSCHLEKSKKASHPLKTKNSNKEILSLLHMDLCGPMRTESINKKRTDNETEFVNKTLTDLFESVGITHQTSVPRSPPQNGVVERQNRTLMEAARTMLIFAKAPLFLWAEAVTTACYTLNRSLIHTLYGKTYYELLKGKKPDLKYFRVFDEEYPPAAQIYSVHVNAAQAPENANGSHSTTNISEGAPAVTPNNIFIIPLKWIFKIKLDEYEDVLKNKA
nr:hypothetical protein [Tanacetum cinerariifolium]